MKENKKRIINIREWIIKPQFYPKDGHFELKIETPTLIYRFHINGFSNLRYLIDAIRWIVFEAKKEIDLTVATFIKGFPWEEK